MSGFADRGGMSTTPATGTTPVTATSSASPSWRFTLSRLQREWDRLVADPRLGERVATWQLPGVVAGATLADVLCAAGMRPAGATPTRWCRRRSARAKDMRSSGCPVTGRWPRSPRLPPTTSWPRSVVLQRLLPGLSSIARRRSRSVEEHLVHTDELLGAAWTVIRAEAARARARLRRLVVPQGDRAPGVRPRPPATAGARARRTGDAWTWRTSTTTAAGDPLGQIVGVLRSVGTDQLRAGDAALITALLRSDRLRDAARQLEVSERTVRNHRAEMVGRLRDALAA